MTSSLTSAELVRLIQQSGVAEERAIRQHLAGLGVSVDGGDARPLAEVLVRDGLLTQFQADQLLQGKWRGFQVGKYRILERIGSGGMGQVFLCRHVHLPTLVALKVLPPSKASSPSALGRFYREARAAAALDHPHLVRTHDIGQEGELHYIVMEYVHGPNLLDVVKKFGPLSVERVVTYLYHVADALDYAHHKGLVHRDIKPGNILVDRWGNARLLDLGLARFCHDEEDNLTVMYDDKMVLGTADYVAPEQIANSHAADIRADIYSLGATAYYLLAGHPVFPTGSVSQKLIWHSTKDPTPLQQVRPEVPEALAAIVMRMLAKDPRQRYQTPAEVQAALLPLLPLEPPLPAAEEMPRYCPLVMRLLGETAQPISSPVRTPPPLLRSRTAVSSVSHGGAGLGDSATSSPGVATTWRSPAATLLTVTPPPRSGSQYTSRSADTDRAALDQTPCVVRSSSTHAPLNPCSIAPTPDPNPNNQSATAPSKPRSAPSRYRWIIICTLLTLLAVIVGLVLWVGNVFPVR
ncbi:MAG: protein kinase [Thermogemmata sp.]|nr:protein kinase [Thermogemmata sp.]